MTMKRMHIHIAVEVLELSVEFYSALFGVRPTVFKPDYAKWMLDDPRVNFTISAHGRASGLDHLGIQVEGTEELTEVSARLQVAEQPVLEQPHANCCYARSDKAWSVDPQGIAWETFLTTGESTVYGEDELVSFERPYTSRSQVGEVASHGCCMPAMP
jgi:catechol 2,3-dioxygenase-like lactoylglutathione lyase family enzyme